jgi:SAM-dependent methyltransferase
MTWHEEDAFWATFGPTMFTDEAWERAAAEIDGVLGIAEVEPPARVLDLCCGPGRHALELCRRGFAVTGVDRTAGYLAEARARAGTLSLQRCDLVEADAREFVRPGAFELVVNLFTSFGYFEDPAGDRRMLENIHRSLVPGGTLVMDLMSKEVFARIYRARDWRPLADGSFMLEEREVMGAWEGVRNRWIRIRDGKVSEARFDLRLYSATELSRLLEETGFVEVAVFGGLDGRPYDHKAERLVIRAEAG